MIRRALHKTGDYLVAVCYLVVVARSWNPSPHHNEAKKQLDEFPGKMHATIAKTYSDRARHCADEAKYYADKAERAFYFAAVLAVVSICGTIVGLIAEYYG